MGILHYLTDIPGTMGQGSDIRGSPTHTELKENTMKYADLYPC